MDLPCKMPEQFVGKSQFQVRSPQSAVLSYVWLPLDAPTIEADYRSEGGKHIDVKIEGSFPQLTRFLNLRLKPGI